MSAPTISYPLSNYDKIQKKKKSPKTIRKPICVSWGETMLRCAHKRNILIIQYHPGWETSFCSITMSPPPQKKSQHQEPSDKNKGSINRCCNPPQSPDLNTMLSVRLRLAKSITYHNSPKILHEKFELLKNKYIN